MRTDNLNLEAIHDTSGKQTQLRIRLEFTFRTKFKMLFFKFNDITINNPVVDNLQEMKKEATNE